MTARMISIYIWKMGIMPFSIPQDNGMCVDMCDPVFLHAGIILASHVWPIKHGIGVAMYPLPCSLLFFTCQTAYVAQ